MNQYFLGIDASKGYSDFVMLNAKKQPVIEKMYFAQWTQEVISGSPSSPSYGLYTEKKRLPTPKAMAQVRGLFERSSWQINPDGTLNIVAFLNVTLAKDNNQIIAEFEQRMRPLNGN